MFCSFRTRSVCEQTKGVWQNEFMTEEVRARCIKSLVLYCQHQIPNPLRGRREPSSLRWLLFQPILTIFEKVALRAGRTKVGIRMYSLNGRRTENIAMASNRIATELPIAMVSNQIAMASNRIAMALNLVAMASNRIAMASKPRSDESMSLLKFFSFLCCS